MSEQVTNEDKSPAAAQQKDNQDKSKALNKKIEMIIKQVKTLYALRYTKTDKQPHEIIPNLYLGSVGAALSKDVLIALNIKYVLTAMDEMKHPFPDIITEYKIIRVKDSKTEKIMNYFDESNEFIHKAISSQQNVLVHCFAGVSRSSTFVLAYLMKHQNKSFNEALAMTQTARPVVKPNQNFIQQLQQYEQTLLKEKSTEEQSFKIQESQDIQQNTNGQVEQVEQVEKVEQVEQAEKVELVEQVEQIEQVEQQKDEQESKQKDNNDNQQQDNNQNELKKDTNENEQQQEQQNQEEKNDKTGEINQDAA